MLIIAVLGVVDVERVTYFAVTVLPDAIICGQNIGIDGITTMIIPVFIWVIRNGKYRK